MPVKARVTVRVMLRSRPRVRHGLSIGAGGKEPLTSISGRLAAYARILEAMVIVKVRVRVTS